MGRTTLAKLLALALSHQEAGKTLLQNMSSSQFDENTIRRQHGSVSQANK